MTQRSSYCTITLVCVISFFGFTGKLLANPIADRQAGVQAAEAGDYDQAITFWQRAAEAGDATAAFNLGVLFDQDAGGNADTAKAIYWYHRAANEGIAQADFNLGNLFLLGRGVSADKKEARRRFTRAASAGYAPAQFNLGKLLESVTPAETEAAFRWYQKAADQNQPDAMLRIARAYATGTGKVQDRDHAILWYERFREQSDALVAQRELALLYLENEQTHVKGQQLLRQAAERGDAESQYHLGLLYGQGRGVIQDYGQASFWYQRAARQHVPDAQYLLCLSYSLGKGVVVDVIRAHVWCEAAAEKNVPGAKDALTAIKSAMTEHELLTAEKLAPMLNPNENN